MGLLTDFSPAGMVKSIAESTVGKVVEKVLDFIPDPVQKANLALQMRQLDLQEETANMANAMQQIAVNIEEAKHEGIFKGGWRSMIGWACAGGITYNFVLLPFISTLARIWYPEYQPIKLDLSELTALVTGMLGLGYYRSNEKQAIIAAKQ